MYPQDTFWKVRRIIAVHGDIPEDAVRLESLLKEDLGLDSLAALDILFDVEEEFGIGIPEEQSLQLQSVQDLCASIDTMLAQR